MKQSPFKIKKGVKITCPRCHGNKFLFTGYGQVVCPTCAGIGKIMVNKGVK